MCKRYAVMQYISPNLQTLILIDITKKNPTLHYHTNPNPQNCLQNQSLKCQMRVAQGACTPIAGFPDYKRKR